MFARRSFISSAEIRIWVCLLRWCVLLSRYNLYNWQSLQKKWKYNKKPPAQPEVFVFC